MPDTKYEIEYVVNSTRMVAGIDRALAKIAQLDAAFLKSIGLMVRYQSLINTIGGSLAAMGVRAGITEKAVAGVGRGGNATQMATRLNALIAALNATNAAAQAASPSVAQVGAGGAPGRVGGGGGRGGGGKPESVAGQIMAGATRGALAYAGYRALRKIGTAAGESVQERREFYRGAGDVVVDYQKDLNELLVLQGLQGDPDKGLRQDLAFQKETNLAPDKSMPFRLAYGGAISAAMDQRTRAGLPTITDDVQKKLELETGKMTARFDLDPKTGGMLAGLLGVSQTVPTAEGGAQDISRVLEILNVKGVGRVSELASSLVGISGQFLEEGGQGYFTDYAQMAARLSATTTAESGSAARSAKRIEQSARLLRKYDEMGEGKHAGHGAGELLGSIAGITSEDTFETALAKLTPHLQDEKGGFSQADQILKGFGFGNFTERKAIIEEMKVTPMARAALSSPDIAARTGRTKEAFTEWRATLPGKRQTAENAEFAATVEAGMAERRLETARMEMRTQMTREDTLKAGPLGHMLDIFHSGVFSAGGVSGEELRVDERVIQSLRERAGGLGMDLEAKYPDLAHKERFLGLQDEKAIATSYAAASEEIEGIEEFRKKLMETAQAAGRIGKPQGGNAPPAGDGGAGTIPMRR